MGLPFFTISALTCSILALTCSCSTASLGSCSSSLRMPGGVTYLQAGASLEAQDEQGMTLLDLASDAHARQALLADTRNAQAEAAQKTVKPSFDLRVPYAVYSLVIHMSCHNFFSVSL